VNFTSTSVSAIASTKNCFSATQLQAPTLIGCNLLKNIPQSAPFPAFRCVCRLVVSSEESNSVSVFCCCQHFAKKFFESLQQRLQPPPTSSESTATPQEQPPLRFTTPRTCPRAAKPCTIARKSRNAQAAREKNLKESVYRPPGALRPPAQSVMPSALAAACGSLAFSTSGSRGCRRAASARRIACLMTPICAGCIEKLRSPIASKSSV
jgi:hypothetical protein